MSGASFACIQCMRGSSILVVLVLGCSPPWPELGPCAGSLPGLGDGGERTVTFPPRDFVCEDPDAVPCENSVPLRSTGRRTVTVRDELGGATVVYLLDVITLPRAIGRWPRLQAVGFDLDGVDTGHGSNDIDADCQQFNRDFESPYEPSLGGVDNAFESLIGSAEILLDAIECPGGTTDGCLDALLRQDTQTGPLLLLLELTGVDSLEHDPEVSVALHLGRMADGAAPLTSGPVGEPGTRVLPDQIFETVRTVVEPAPGDILHHRLRVRWPRVELPRERYGYPSILSRVELRASVCADGLSRGHMGGLSANEDLFAQVLEQYPGEAETFRAVFETVADIQPSAADPIFCEYISTAYAVEGVPAARLP